MTYKEIKDKYTKFIYDKYEIIDEPNTLKIKYHFEIPGLSKFNPTLEIPKRCIKNEDIDNNILNEMIFDIGMVELISYWKICMPKEIIINAGYLDEYSKSFYKKLYYNGLGEFRYTNNIDISYEDFCKISSNGKKYDFIPTYHGKGNLVTIGGGKDSVVALNLLKNMNNMAFILNPKKVQIDCAIEANVEYLAINRTLDENMLRLNKEGYLNGHTPFSALLSFITYLVAYLSNRKYIVLSNETSANEANVRGTNINHQYSKSLEYENDFRSYVKTKYDLGIEYFSLLRPFYEIKIAELFSKYKNFHNIFKSCNKGSKENPWIWCCNCSKCLFVYIILSAFLSDEEMINIFGENLYEKEELLETFKDLIGITDNKPFDCVGTYEEVNFAIQKRIAKEENKLPKLLEYYKNNINISVRNDLLEHFDSHNNLPKEFLDIIKGA